MRLAVDANILIGELLRTRGRELVAREDLELFVAEQAWGEALHELEKRVSAISRQGGLPEEGARNLLCLATRTAEQHVTVVGGAEYGHLEEEARRRIP